MSDKKKTLTTAAGIPVADNQNSVTAGPRGPLLVQDWQLFEKHAHFNRERVPERVVHAKGSAAFGTFTIASDVLAPYTRSQFLSRAGSAECFLRFSTVAGERGAADAERDVRGFALKVYTGEGNWGPGGVTTRRCFSSAIRTSFQILSARKSVIRGPTCAIRSRCGTFGRFRRSRYTRLRS